MALRTRWPVLGAVTVLSLVVVAVLPPRACGTGNRSLVEMMSCSYGSGVASPQPAVAERTRDRLRQAQVRRQLADSILSSRAVRRLTVAGGLSVAYEAPLTVDSARRWLALAAREMALIPGSGHGAPVVLVLLSDSRRFAQSDADDSRPPRWWYRPELDRFTTGAHGACLVVLRLRASWRFDYLLGQERPALLDWCALYGRFGAPGAEVERWAGHAFSLGWRDPSSLAELVQTMRADSARAIDDWQVSACQAGSGEACLAFLGAGRNARAAWFFQRERARDLLAWLLATGDPVQFQRFWRAQGTLNEALRAGYDRPGAEILQNWARSRFRAAPRQGMARPKLLLAGAVWFSLAMVAAFVAMQRRQID